MIKRNLLKFGVVVMASACLVGCGSKATDNKPVEATTGVVAEVETTTTPEVEATTSVEMESTTTPEVETTAPVETEKPTEAPTQEPTVAPTEKPTEKPTEAPTQKPTEKPTEKPTQKPTEAPTQKPTEAPAQTLGTKPTWDELVEKFPLETFPELDPFISDYNPSNYREYVLGIMSAYVTLNESDFMACHAFECQIGLCEEYVDPNSIIEVIDLIPGLVETYGWSEEDLKYDLEDILWVKSHFDYNKMAYNYVILTYCPDILTVDFDEDYVTGVLRDVDFPQENIDYVVNRFFGN